MEALERLKERVEVWKTAEKWPEGKPVTSLNLSWSDHQELLKADLPYSKSVPILAARKIKTLTREINTLKKKLEY